MGRILKRGVQASRRFVSKSDVGDAVIVCSKMTIVDLGADQVVIEEIAEGETVEKSLHAIGLNGMTGPVEVVIDRIASIVLIKSNAPIALRKAIVLSGRIDSSAPIVPAAGEIIECYVLSSSHETLKE